MLALSIEVPVDARLEIAELRRDEPWYPEAAAALASIQDGEATEETWAAIAPFTYGRWDQTTRAYNAAVQAGRHPEADAAFFAEGAFDPPVTRTALAALEVPVLVVAGSWDVGNPPRIMAEVAQVFPNGRLAVQPSAGHFPWLDDAAWFCQTVNSFLAE